jgi:hypothetical protein
MKQFFGRLLFEMTRDDLFMRFACAIGGLLFGGLGIVSLIEGVEHGMNLSVPFQVLVWTVLIALTVLGAALALRSVLSIRSRAGHFLDQHLNLGFLAYPDQSMLYIVLPAVVLTLLLRCLGVRGQHASWCQQNVQQVR